MKKKSNPLDIYSIFREQFKFLEGDYDFKIAKHKKNKYVYEMIYINKTTVVKILYEFSQAYIFITLYSLVNGEFIDNPIIITANSKLSGYALDDILLIREPSALIKPAYEYKENVSNFYDLETGLSNYVFAFANNLRKFGAEVLSGNFKIFNELDKVVKERAQKFNS